MHDNSGGDTYNVQMVTNISTNKMLSNFLKQAKAIKWCANRKLLPSIEGDICRSFALASKENCPMGGLACCAIDDSSIAIRQYNIHNHDIHGMSTL